MIPKYKVEYGVPFRNSMEREAYETDDPVSCEGFLSDALEKRLAIYDIKHNGDSLPKIEFDRLIKNAANSMAGQHICASLHIKPEEEQFRFGFAT